MSNTARRHSGYQEIAAKLRDQIENGELSAGTKLDGEAKLAEQFTVARDTIRRALEALTEEGLLTTVVGRGRFVAGGTTEAGADYERVAAVLLQRITTGRLKPGDSLPSESDVCSELAVSRTTARKAFKELEHEGYAQSQQQGQVRVVTTPTDYHDNGDRSTAGLSTARHRSTRTTG